MAYLAIGSDNHPFMYASWGKKEWSLAVFADGVMKNKKPAHIEVVTDVIKLGRYAIQLDDHQHYGKCNRSAKFTDDVVLALQCGSLKVLQHIIIGSGYGTTNQSNFRAAWPNTKDTDNIFREALGGGGYRTDRHRESVKYILTQLPKPYTVALLAEIAYFQDCELLDGVDNTQWELAFRELFRQANRPARELKSAMAAFTDRTPSLQKTCGILLEDLKSATAPDTGRIVQNAFCDDALFFLLNNALHEAAYRLIMAYGCSIEAMLRVKGGELCSTLYCLASTADEESLRVAYMTTLFDLGCPLNPSDLTSKRFCNYSGQLWAHVGGKLWKTPVVDEDEDGTFEDEDGSFGEGELASDE